VVTGGLLAGTVGWRFVFLVTVPVSMTALTLARHVLAPDTAAERRSLDWVGAVLATGAVITLVHGAVDAGDHAWTSLRVLGLLVASVVVAAAFVAVERKVTDPLVPLELFGSRMLRRGVVLALLGGSTRASSFVLIALYLQQVLAMPPQQAGIAMVPTSLAGFAVSLGVLPRALKTFGPLRTLVLGLVILAGGQLWLAYPPENLGYVLAVLPGLLLVASGVALSFTPTTLVLASAVPTAHTGLASGLSAAAMQVGAALGAVAFIIVGASAGEEATAALDGPGFTAASTAAAGVALVTATLGWRAATGRANGAP
jgi:predicted MFS family arabinose efflux permease